MERDLGLRLGGIGAWSCYPLIIWELAFGAYFMSGALLSTSTQRDGGEQMRWAALRNLSTSRKQLTPEPVCVEQPEATLPIPR